MRKLSTFGGSAGPFVARKGRRAGRYVSCSTRNSKLRDRELQSENSYT
jgi:hypothetical protein